MATEKVQAYKAVPSHQHRAAGGKHSLTNHTDMGHQNDVDVHFVLWLMWEERYIPPSPVELARE